MITPPSSPEKPIDPTDPTKGDKCDELERKVMAGRVRVRRVFSRDLSSVYVIEPVDPGGRSTR